MSFLENLISTGLETTYLAAKNKLQGGQPLEIPLRKGKKITCLYFKKDGHLYLECTYLHIPNKQHYAWFDIYPLNNNSDDPALSYIKYLEKTWTQEASE